MPASFLRKAAVAALASTSGRKLPDYNNKPDYGGDALTVYNCPDDICGDALVPDLALTEDSGTPVLTSEGVALTDELHAHQIYMADNNIPGLFNNDAESKIYVNGDNIEVQVHLRDSEGYNHEDHACELSVTMTSIEGTSATFAGVHGLPGPFKTSDLVSDETGGAEEYLKATIPTPDQAKNSLGTIKAGIGMKLTCNDPSDGLKPKNITLITGAESSNHEKGFQAEYTYTRDADEDGRWAWEVLPDDGGTLSGLSEAKITETHSHTSRQVSVAGKSVVVGRKGAAIRFPEGKWAQYNSGAPEKINYQGQLQCKVRADAKGKAAGEFFENHAEFLDHWYDENVQDSSDPYSYGEGEDANCLGGVCDGRMHRVQFNFTTALGFEAPYTEYFKEAPAIICENGLSNAPQKEIEGIAASKGNGDSENHYRIGLDEFEKGYDTFSTSSNPSDAVQNATKVTIAGGDYGDAFFKGSDTSFMGETQIFQHTEAQAYWRHVRDQFDFNVKIVNNVTKDDITKSDYLVQNGIGYYYTGASDEAGVRSKLGDIIQALDEATVPRPTLYGETRGVYKVCVLDANGDCKADGASATSEKVMFRRDSSNIKITLDFKDDGETVHHTGDPGIEKDADGKTVNFPAPISRDFVVKEISLTDKTYTLADDAVKAMVDERVGENDEACTFLKIFAEDNADALFLAANDSPDTSNTCGKNSPWCTTSGSAPFLCHESRVTATRFVTKDTQDDRQPADEKSVSKAYSRAAATRPENANGWFTNSKPVTGETDRFVDSKAKNVGDTLPDQTYSVNGWGSLGNEVDLAFSPENKAKLEFNCHLSQHQEVFKANYNDPCTNAPQEHKLFVDVDVAYPEGDSDSSYLTQEVSRVKVNGQDSISEWRFQRHATPLTFHVGSKGSIPAAHFDGLFAFQARYAGAGDFADATCTQASAGGYDCKIEVAKDRSWDETQIDEGAQCCKTDHRGASCSTDVECPYVEIKATAQVWERNNCNGDAKPKDLLFLAQQAGKTQSTYKVYLTLTGANEIYDGSVKVKNIGADKVVRTIAKFNGDENLVPGANGQYQTHLENLVDSNQPKLKGKQFAIEFGKHEDDDAEYIISTPAGALPLSVCLKQTFSDEGCKDAASLPDGGRNLKLSAATSTTVYVRATDDKTEFCDGKFKGEDAYDGKFQFTIKRKHEIAHTFHVPVECGHTEVYRLETDGQQVGSAWYKKNYAVKIVGSALNKNYSPMTVNGIQDMDSVVQGGVEFMVAFDDDELERDDAGNILNRLNEVIFSQQCTEASNNATIKVQVDGYTPTLEIDLDCPAIPLKLNRGTQELFSSDAPTGTVHNLKPDSIDKEKGTVTINDLHVSNRIPVEGTVPECSLSGRSKRSNDNVVVSVLSTTFDTDSEESSFVIGDTCDTMVTVSVTCRISTLDDTPEGNKIVKFRVPCPKAELELHAIQGEDSQKVAQGADPTLLREQVHAGDIVTFNEMHLDNRDPNLKVKAVNITTKAYKDGKLMSDESEKVEFSGDEIGDGKADSVGLKFTKGGANCDFVTLTFTSRRYEYLMKPDDSTNAVVESVKFYMACPNAKLRLYNGENEIESGALIAADSFHGDIVRFKDLHLRSRDPRLTNKLPAIQGIANEPDDFVSFEYVYGIGDEYSRKKVGIDFETTGSNALTCNFMQITFTTQRTDLADKETVMFRVQCPRVESIKAKVDDLKLDYTITDLSFSLTEARISLPADPANVEHGSETKVVGFTDGTCFNPGNISFDAKCDLSSAIGSTKSYDSASDMITVIDECDGDVDWGTDDGGKEHITATGYVTRVYQREHPFKDRLYDYHCGASTVSLEVDRSATKTVTVAVQSAPVVTFDVHVSRAEFVACSADGQQLQVDIDTIYKNNKGSNANKYQYKGLEVQNAAVNPLGGKFTQIEDAPNSGVHQLRYESDCASGAALEALQDIDITFEMQREDLGLVHTGRAAVGVEVKLEEEEERDIGEMSQDNITVTKTCANGDGKYATCTEDGAGQILATDDVKLVISIEEPEASAFNHIYGDPEYLVGTTGEFKMVKDLTSEYKARSGNKLVDNNNAQVALRALPFAGKSVVQIRWKVSRVEIKTRLRRLLTVTYALGADGSVSKSASFSVAPAVRESSGASAVGDETVELITEKSVPNGTERTTEVLEEKKDNGLMIGMIISSSVLGVGVIALAVIVAVRKSKEELPGAGGNSDSTQLLWKTNRFTGEAF